MEKAPLPRTMRIRIAVTAVGAGLLVLLTVPLAVLELVSGKGSTGAAAMLLAWGLGVPIVFGLVMWWTVRRYRNNPEVRRRQPHGKAARILLVGNLISIFLANIVRDLVPPGGWVSLSFGALVVLIGAYASIAVAKRYDPRIHFFRRIDPLPEGEELRDEEPVKLDH